MSTLEIPTRDENGYPRQIMLTTAFTQLKEAGLDDIAEVMQQMHKAYAAAIKRIAELEKDAQTVDDLAMLTRKLIVALRKAAPNDVLPERAVDFLQRRGLQGSILRDGA